MSLQYYQTGVKDILVFKCNFLFFFIAFSIVGIIISNLIIKNMDKVPSSFKVWFVVHFVVCMLFGFPLIFAPEWAMDILGIPIISTLAPRLIGAAMIGMGSMSFIARDSSADVYRELLTFKVMWSLAGMVAILLYIFEGGHSSAWVFFAVFFVFNCVWMCFRIQLNRFSD